MNATATFWRRYARRDPPVMLTASIALITTFLALYGWFVRTPTGQLQDIRLLALAQQLAGGIWMPVAALREPLLVTAAGVVTLLVISSARRHEWRRIGAVGAAVGGSALLAELLKLRVLTRPYVGDFGYTYNTFPSGHVAVTTSLVVSALVLWPRPPSTPLRLAAGIVTVASCAASVVGYDHRPSDVGASVVLVALVATLALWTFDRPRRPAIGMATPVADLCGSPS